MAPVTTRPAARVALCLLAVVVAGWLAVGLRAAIPETRAQKTIQNGQLEGDGREQVQRLLVDARRLNPDSRPRVTEASMLVLTERPREAARILGGVVREEPENAQAWAILAGATRSYDKRRNARALARLRRLKPPVTP